MSYVKRKFVLWPDRPEIRQSARAAISDAPTDEPIEIIMRPYRKSKSDEQRGYIWGVIYPCIRQFIEDSGRGSFTNDALHEYMTKRFGIPTLTDFMGEKTEGFKSLGDFNVKEASEYIEHVLQYSAVTWGCYVPEADKNWRGPPS